MSELEQTYQNYEVSKNFLFDTLKTVDTTINGEHKPQLITTTDWVEMENSPGVYIKNVSLVRPDSFVISLIHGIKGACGEKHTIYDDLEVHCVTGKVMINGIVFNARDTWFIPSNTEYNFTYLEESYLTIKFIPKNRDNFKIYGPVLEAKG